MTETRGNQANRTDYWARSLIILLAGAAFVEAVVEPRAQTGDPIMAFNNGRRPQRFSGTMRQDPRCRTK
jgi:hypothetical protein